MRALGIPVWLPKGMELTDEPEHEQEEPSVLPAAASASAETGEKNRVNIRTEIAVPTVKPPIHYQPAAEIAAVPVDAPDCSQLGWTELQATVARCEACVLHKSRTQTVFGTGDTHASWMVIGEAPGAEEDRQGQPFVGRAGQLLNNMLAAVGLPREAVYIANILKCRPPNNRDPKPEEAAHCRGYLERQIALVKPELILVVGRIAAHNLLQVNTPLGQLRGTLHHTPKQQIPVIVTYHPAYLLRQPAEKRKAWQDLQRARQFMLARGS